MAKMKMKPLGDNVIVKRLEADEVTAGGIYLPDSAKEKPKRGTVMAIGSGKLNDQGQRSATRREAARPGRQESRSARCGRNVVLEKSFGSPTVTKDGVTVAKEIELEDPYENMGAQMVKEVASKTSNVAGDGTTTATIYAEAIYDRGPQEHHLRRQPHGRSSAASTRPSPRRSRTPRP
jgi:hypothetical protein